jgi:adenylate cyclase
MEAVHEAARAVEDAGAGKAMPFRAALHHGTFLYGNIGGADRLDFTVIGPPINYAARLLAGASQLDCDRVISADLAERIGEPCRPAGELLLKGFDGAQKIWKF